MKSTVESLAATKRKITVEVPYEELKPALDKTYADLGQQLNIPGFRRGHVPARIIDQRVGRGAVIQQTINDKLGEYYGQALNENELIPLGQPEIEVTGLPNTSGAPGGDLAFTAEVEVLPEAQVPDLSDVTLEVDPVDVTDKEVEEELDRLRGRFATLKKVERAAQNGDFTSLDLTARIGDEVVDSVSGVSYEVGSGTMLDGMDDALVGMQEGETKTFTSKLRGGEHEGEEGQVEVTLKAVKERELPELNDDFVQESSEFDTVDELREDTRKNVASGKGAEQAIQARDKLMEVLRERMELPLPEGVLKDQLQAAAKQAQGQDEDAEAEADRDAEAQQDAAEASADEAEGADEPQVDPKRRQAIEESLREQMLLERLAAEVKPKLGQRELFQYIMQMAQSYGMDATQLMRDQNRIGALAAELTRNKAVAKILSQVKVVDTNGQDVDLSRFTADPAEEEEAQRAAAAAAQEAAGAQDGDQE